MVKHYVMWRFRDFAEGNEKKENMEIVKNRLLDLCSKLDIVKKIEIGSNICKSDMAYDMVLYMEFDSQDALEAYKTNPEHMEISKFVAKVRYERATVDCIG